MSRWLKPMGGMVAGETGGGGNCCRCVSEHELGCDNKATEEDCKFFKSILF